MFYLYILYSQTRTKYYVGVTGNLAERLLKHNTNHKGFTGHARNWKIVYQEVYENKTAAYLREKEIKKWKSKKLIEKLIALKSN